MVKFQKHERHTTNICTAVRTIHIVGRSIGAFSCTTDKHTEHTKHSKSGKSSSLVELVIGHSVLHCGIETVAALPGHRSVRDEGMEGK